MWRATTSIVTFAAGVLVGLLVRGAISGTFGKHPARNITAIKLGATGTETLPSPSTSGSGIQLGKKENFYKTWDDPMIWK